MEYLIRLIQAHETFRKPELEALAILTGVNLEFITYSPEVPFCIVRLDSEESARALIKRSILSDAIYELWGVGNDYEALHEDVKIRSQHLWEQYKEDSFRFCFNSFKGKRSSSSQRAIMESFSYLGLQGQIRMKDATHHFWVHEHFEPYDPVPKNLYLGRLVGSGDRGSLLTYDLKKRGYISTTSMDSELALLTANLALSAPGRLIYDPFVGTGSFSIACSHFGAVSLGSDIDGRAIRGTGKRNLASNFAQYGLTSLWLDSFVADLTNSPLRIGQYLDGIVCDPPYGIREGCKVLGSKLGKPGEAVYIDGKPAHLLPGYIPPKKAYSFVALLDDILYFASQMLLDEGRLALWMPTANDEDLSLAIPQSRYLELVSVCVQEFNNWSRRLLVYRRIPAVQTGPVLPQEEQLAADGTTANELNKFRKKYFEGFKNPTPSS